MYGPIMYSSPGIPAVEPGAEVPQDQGRAMPGVAVDEGAEVRVVLPSVLETLAAMGSVRGVLHDLAAFHAQLQGRHPGILLPEPHDGRADARRDDEADPRRLVILWVRGAGKDEEESGIRDG